MTDMQDKLASIIIAAASISAIFTLINFFVLLVLIDKLEKSRCF